MAEPLTVLVIEAAENPVGRQLHDLWAYRELLYILAWRDFKVRYKQTVLGAAWALIQPFFTMVVFSIFFGYLGRIPSDGLPYPVFAYCALLPWSLFAHGLTESSNSLVNNQSLLTKVYFPRLIIPIAPLFVGVVDFGIAFVVLMGMMLVYGITPGVAVLTVPLFVLLTVLTALAVGMWLSALNVEYRDVRYTIPFLDRGLWHDAFDPARPLPGEFWQLFEVRTVACIEALYDWR